MFIISDRENQSNNKSSHSSHMKLLPDFVSTMRGHCVLQVFDCIISCVLPEFGDSRHHAMSGHKEVIFSNQKSGSDTLEVCLSSPGYRSQYLKRCLLDQLPVVNRCYINQQDGNNVAIPSENAVPPNSAPIPRSHNDNLSHKAKIALSYTTLHLLTFPIPSLFTSNVPFNPPT